MPAALELPGVRVALRPYPGKCSRPAVPRPGSAPAVLTQILATTEQCQAQPPAFTGVELGELGWGVWLSGVFSALGVLESPCFQRGMLQRGMLASKVLTSSEMLKQGSGLQPSPGFAYVPE